jgi:hypothetical protein
MKKTPTATAKTPRRFLPIPELTEAERERFESLIDRTPGYGPRGDCHRWKGAHTGESYPAVVVRGKTLHAHRVALRLAIGADFDDKLCCHVCDFPGCVNGQHLFAGTAKQNFDDMKTKGRWKPPARKGASTNGERNRHNSNAPDARPARNDQHRPTGHDPNNRGRG